MNHPPLDRPLTYPDDYVYGVHPAYDANSPYGYAHDPSPFGAAGFGEETGQWHASTYPEGYAWLPDDTAAWGYQDSASPHLHQAFTPGVDDYAADTQATTSTYYTEFPPYQPEPQADPPPEPQLDLPPEEPAPDTTDTPETADVIPAAPSRRRRRSRPRPVRSAFLRITAPSLAALGITAAATAATVSDTTEAPAPVASPDPADEATGAPAANAAFDAQLEGLSAAVDDYADRASHTQGQIDLQHQREQEERERERREREAAEEAAEEAARLEALRPKFALPVEQASVTTYFGEVGPYWMSTHTGIDFAGGYGTPVMAATDGHVTAQWNDSYGNMVILTAEDGTETWYTHLDSAAYSSGYVQAGTVIGYAGSTGNSTGPHLHFEVRPGGGDPIDPLTWLREQGLPI